MNSQTLIYLLIGIIVMLVGIVVFLMWRMLLKNNELRQKNDVIVREVRRNQDLIDRAVQNGIRRAAML